MGERWVGLREICIPVYIQVQCLQSEPKPLSHSTDAVCNAPICYKPFQRFRNPGSQAIQFHCLAKLGQLLCMQVSLKTIKVIAIINVK